MQKWNHSPDSSCSSKSSGKAILAERGDGDEPTRHKSEEAGVRPKLGGTSPTFNFTKEVKNIYHTCHLAKAENIHVLKDSLGRQALLQAEQKEYEAVKSLEFC